MPFLTGRQDEHLNRKSSHRPRHLTWPVAFRGCRVATSALLITLRAVRVRFYREQPDGRLHCKTDRECPLFRKILISAGDADFVHVC